MFADNFTNIFLDDYVIYFLAKELNLEQIIGIGVEFDTLNKEIKNEVKQKCYDFMLQDGIISMDFGGNTTVGDAYKEIVTCFESPEYCCIVQETDSEEKASRQRKIYKSNGKYIGLDYTDEITCAVYKFEDIQTADRFAFLNLDIHSNSTDMDFKPIAAENAEKEISEAKKCVIVTEYIVSNAIYEAVQTVYVQKDDWYAMEANENGQAILKNASYPVALKV